MSAPTVRGPREIPDLRLWLADEWAPGRVFRRAQAVRAAEVEAAVFPPDMDRSDWERKTESASDWERRTLLEAELWWVAPSMVELTKLAAESIPADVTAADLPIPAESGFVVFGSPIVGTDVMSGKGIIVDAVAWNARTRVPGDPSHPRQVALSMSSYRYVSIDDFMSSDGDPAAADPALRPPMGSPGLLWLPMGRSDWPVTDGINVAPWPMADHVLASFVEDRRLVAALFTLLAQQGITTRTIEKPERAAIRRHKRAGIDPNLADVQVVELRRPRYVDGDKPEGDGVAWSKRWLVGGHMRWQPCGEGRKDRKLIFIAPYVKGPDDKPFVAPQRVNSWVR